MIRYIFLGFVFYSLNASSNEVCDVASNKCAQLSSGAAWILSIIETSIVPCKSHPEIKNWISSNDWLIKKVKNDTPNYLELVRAQNRGYWKVENQYISKQCGSLVELIKSGKALSSHLR